MTDKPAKSGTSGGKTRLFWRIQWECVQRMLTPAVMYLFMSTLLLATQMITAEHLKWLRILLGTLCILGGAAFNAHLCFSFGGTHYEAYLAAQSHRENGSAGSLRPEREYRPWKGFYIGFLIGVPVIVLSVLAAIPGAMNGWAAVIFVLFAGWAIMPVNWFGGTGAWFALSMIMIVLPVLVSGIFYILGAMRQKRKKLEQEERARKVKEAGERARQERLMREQTEEQRRKTLQSKKKKR